MHSPEVEAPRPVLDGVTVLELCEVYQGPVAAQSLADFGARVIKVERGPRGDSLRGSDTNATAKGEMSSHFAAANRNKESICLDLKTEDGLNALRTLARTADVLMHNYRPGVMEKLGLGYEALSVLNPRLIYAAASGFGETGPWAGLAGQDILIQSVSGVAARGTARPEYINAPVTDFASGMLLAQGILLALLERERSGRGQKVSVSLLDTAVAMQGLEAASVLNHGVVTRWIDLAPNFPIRTADGWVTVLGFFRDNPLQLICQALDIEDLSETLGASTQVEQLARRDEIVARLTPVFGALTSEDAVGRLQRVGILAAPVLDFADTLRLPQVVHNGMIARTPVEGHAEIAVVNQPLRLSRTPHVLRRGPPRLGEHTAQVLASIGLNVEPVAPDSPKATPAK